MGRFSLKAKAVLAGKPVAAPSAHTGKVTEQAILLPKCVHHILKLLMEGGALQVRLVIKPARPELAAAFSEVAAQVSHTAAFQILLTAAGIKPIGFIRFNRPPGQFTLKLLFCFTKDGFKGIQRSSGILTIGV